MTTLRQAAQAVVARWDGPLWQDGPTTGSHIATLRKALEAPEQEPVLYQRRIKADWSDQWTAWDDCSEATFKDVLRVSRLHDWTNQARALYTAPQASQIEAITKERDEYRAAADKMAAAHKIERDALAADIRQMSEDLVAIEKLRREKDARMYTGMHKLMAAAKLAMIALEKGGLLDINLAIAALKKAGVV